MITPIRGRKRTHGDASAICLKFTDDNPDKGTETKDKELKKLQKEKMFTDDNPDKGTETHIKLSVQKKCIWSLQMITPIRGRKQSSRADG